MKLNGRELDPGIVMKEIRLPSLKAGKATLTIHWKASSQQ